MKKTIACAALPCVLVVLNVMTDRGEAQNTGGFQPRHIAVLRAGDGKADLKSHQTPVFVDEYDPGVVDQPSPSFSVAIPKTGKNAIWINGNAATEGGLARSADHTVLTISGYCGDILSQKGTPSKLPYARGICVIARDGSISLPYVGTNWYGLSGGKTNPRGAVTDGTNNFWGCGSEIGTLFCNPAGNVIPIKSVASTRAIRILNGTLYFSIMTSDGMAGEAQGPVGGIYDFVDGSGGEVPLPTNGAVHINLVVPDTEPFTHSAGFAINPDRSVAYMADQFNGVAKYVKTGNDWKLAYHFYIPGYDGPNSGILTNAASTKVRAGCFGLAVDFGGAHPIVYATTTESIGHATADVNANRLIRIDDTNTVTTGEAITNFGLTLARAGGTNISFRAIDFTPEAGK